jgi:hypothetical protein
MGSELNIRLANHCDIDGIVELQKNIYPQYKRDAPFFAWQCFENVNPSVLIVAQQDNAIVGTFGIQKIKTTCGLYGGQLSWLIIDKQKRRSGLFAEMGSLALKFFSDLDFIFIFANKNAVLPCKKAFDMKFIGSMSPMNLSSIPLDCCHEYSVQTVSTETAFPIYANSTDTISFLRTENYRRWRYAYSTSHKYFKISISTGEYAIIKLFAEKKDKQNMMGDIVDFDCSLTDESRVQNLFQVASFELRKMGASIITTWAVLGTQLQFLLNKMGFSQGEPSSSMGIKLLNKKYKQLYEFSNWHIVQSDASNY